tara:strand:- start:271 stop:828 length:558 start_codon:yes stop_codon:yes gene_type:complete
VNSIGIWLGFRTAFAQGLDNNIRKKINNMGFKLTRFEFLIGDFIVHTFPAILTMYNLIHEKRRIHYRSVTYALTLSTWFVFRQVGKLDASDIYVPHPWKRGWFGAIVGMICTPSLIDAFQHSKNRKLLITLFFMSIPLLSTNLDEDLKKKYDLEFILPKLQAEKIAKKKIERSQSDISLHNEPRL